LEISRQGTLLERPDTIRLLPKEVILENVTVKPAQPIRLTPVPLEARQKSFIGFDKARGLTPGTSLAVLHRPPDTTATYYVTRLIVAVPRNHEVEAGRLRILLVNVISEPTPYPGANDLLPIAAIFTAKQVNSAVNHEVEVDVSSYHLRLPKEGLCVVAECLPTEPNEVPVARNKVKQGNKVRIEIITATDPKNPATYRQTPIENFIWVNVAESNGKAITWRRGQYKEGGAWIQNWGTEVKTSPGANRTTNALIDMEVEKE
jgi:hypothetical protein